MAPFNLSGGTASIVVKVQPLVLLNICDAYTRRSAGQTRVIGTLLGTITDNVVEVKSSYAVPHSETNAKVAVDIPHHKNLFDLHQKVTPKEQIVGWYATGWALSGSDSLIHGFYATECPNPVHLTVDTTLTEGDVAISAYTARKLALGGKDLATDFQQVACSTLTEEVERMGGGLLEGAMKEKLPSEAQGLQALIHQLLALLEQAHAYVSDVAEKRRPGDVAMGRFLADTVGGVPFIAPDEFESLLADSTQDSLLVIYLANLVRTQLALADKLGTASLPLL